MPHLNQLWNDFAPKGLHIFHVESQGHTEEQVREFCEKNNVVFPQVMSSDADFSNFPGGSGLPYAYLIGVDGKVIWQGRDGYKAIIHEEIKKVRFPGLGRLTVAKSLEKAAALFGQGRFDKAHELAAKELAEEGVAADVAADAKYIQERVALRGQRVEKRARDAETEREYDAAITAWSEIAASFKALPLGETAKTELERLKGDATAKKERRASAAYADVLKKIERMADRQRAADLLKAFAEQFEGTKAAEKALKKAKHG
ncbi:MAG: hypothetical protein ACKVX7_09705 [Planctomycetota bacterium]